LFCSGLLEKDINITKTDLNVETMERVLYILLLKIKHPLPSEEEFNHWYEENHIPRVLKSLGFKCAHRYKGSEGFFATIYELPSEEQIQKIKNSKELYEFRKEFMDLWGAYFESIRDFFVYMKTIKKKRGN